MTTATSLSVEIPHQETTPEKQIRVSGAYGGYSEKPHCITKRVNSELRGACGPVFSFVWERTVAFRIFDKQILLSDFVENISYGERSIRDAIHRLQENGWLTVRKNGNRAKIYGVAVQLLQDAGCLEDLPTDGGKSQTAKQAAKIADQNSPPLNPPLKDLKSLNNSTHSTPTNRCVPEAGENGPGPAAEGYEGYVVSQPEIPEQEPEDSYRTYFDPHAEIREPEPEQCYEGYAVSEPEIQIPDHPVAQKLRYCGLYPRSIVKFMRQYEPEHIMAIVENFEEDMGKPHNVKRENFPKVLYSRLRDDITSWGVDSWVSDVQDQFDESVGSDKSGLLGIVQYAALEQNLELRDVMSKLELQGISYDDLAKWAAVDVRVQP